MYRAVYAVPSHVELSMSPLLLCGAASGAFTSLLLTPIELIKCKMQVPIDPSAPMGLRQPSIMGHIASVYRHQGISGFWHGQLGTLIRETGGSAAWFGSNEGVKLFFHRLNHGPHYKPKKEDILPVWQQMIAGAAAGMSYNFLFYPADTIKSRMQTEDVTLATGGKRSFWSIGKAVWQQQGLKGLYRGCGITVGRSAPSSALIFTIYGLLQEKFS
jgi:mitochondrial ornithine carrier protein